MSNCRTSLTNWESRRSTASFWISGSRPTSWPIRTEGSAFKRRVLSTCDSTFRREAPQQTCSRRSPSPSWPIYFSVTEMSGKAGRLPKQSWRDATATPFEPQPTWSRRSRNRSIPADVAGTNRTPRRAFFKRCESPSITNWATSRLLSRRSSPSVCGLAGERSLSRFTPSRTDWSRTPFGTKKHGKA